MIESFVLQVIIYGAFPFYLAQLEKPTRTVAFYVYISIVLLFGGFIGSVLSIPITDTINISAGNIAYGALMLTSILFVIIDRDIFIIKGIVRLVITLNIFVVLMFTAVVWSLSQAEIINPNNTSAAVFNVSIWFTILGGILIICELIFLLYLFEKFKKSIKNIFLLSVVYIFSFIFVLCLDGLLFPLIGFGFSEKLLAIVVGGVKGKLIMAIAYSVPFAIFLYIYRARILEYAYDPSFDWKNLFMSSANLMQNIKANEERLIYLANHDTLTNLHNRRFLVEQLEQSINIEKRNHKNLALLIIDLDHFQVINDSYGHVSGDELLKEISIKLKGHVLETDLLCRVGSDEFGVLLTNLSSPEDAGIIATEIINLISGSWKLANGLNIHIGATIGISFYPEHGTSSELLFQNADAALYSAKNTERGTFQYFTKSMTASARNKIEQEFELRKSIIEGYIEVFYQPQVNIKTGEVYGAEALVRINHPIKGYIQPSEFIPIAESTGLINSLGEKVLRQACLKGKEWLDNGLKPLILSVNISAYQLRHGNIINTVKSILDETEYPAKYLELELTESSLMDNEESLIMVLKKFRDMGIRLSIDDFGTGYSSLLYLKLFPINTLKIDKSFIDGIPNSSDSRVLVSTIISMGKNLGYSIIAEGVEEVDQLEWLKTMNCDYFQGYLKSKPIPADKFRRLYTNN